MKSILNITLFLMLSVNTICLAQEPNLHKLPFEPITETPEHDFGDNNPDVFLCMGDSITQGYGVNSAESYPAILQSMLGRTVINEGLGGARSTYGVRMINTYLNRYKPGYVLLMFGTNDIGESFEDEILENLRQMLNQAKENKTVPILATLTPVSGSRIGKKSTIIRVNDSIRSLTSQEAIPLADVATAFNWNDGYLMSDGLHPTAEGYDIIAKTFYDAIMEFEHQGGGGGGGCSLSGGTNTGGEWLLILMALFGIYAVPRTVRMARRE
jgi:lysophospholipase L1-like esterase